VKIRRDLLAGGHMMRPADGSFNVARHPDVTIKRI
jgi:hypothetical protein